MEGENKGFIPKEYKEGPEGPDLDDPGRKFEAKDTEDQASEGVGFTKEELEEVNKGQELPDEEQKAA